MTNYTELVRKMRTCIGDKKCFEKECRYWSELGCMDGNICCDAAAAIEALQAEADALVHDIKRYVRINAELTTENEALQSEVKKLKRVNLEIFEDLPKLGEWVVKGANRIDCSVCGHSVCFAFGLSDGSFDSYKYCPECGAKMEVQDGK